MMWYQTSRIQDVVCKKMIRLIKTRTIFIVLLLICLFSGLIYSLAANPITLIDWAKGVGGISFLLSAITLGLGQTRIFDFICPLFGMPNLTGTYKGENRSNWPRVKELTKGKKAQKTERNRRGMKEKHERNNNTKRKSTCARGADRVPRGQDCCLLERSAL